MAVPPLTHQIRVALGYRPVHDQKVVLFFVASGLPPDTALELLPVVDGSVTYSPHDVPVQEKLTLAQLEERVAARSA
jgi:hypothetical protein